MADIRRQAGDESRDRQAAMNDLRAAMRQKNECLQDSAHCDNARRAIIGSMKPVINLDPDYFKRFFKEHQAFAASFNDYKYVEELCVMVCVIEAWVTSPTEQAPESDDPYNAIAWMGGLNLHAHASLYFGFSKQELLRCFQIVQEMKEYELDAVTDYDFEFPMLKLKDSEEWMLYFVAAVSMKFKPAVQALDKCRDQFKIDDDLRSDIISSIKSTYWWRNMMMSRILEFAAQGLPAELQEQANRLAATAA
ncbi:MAG: hypothetical protein OEY89_08265 [Gammaproteobacteria bacterium]|nr:hypothetical protein [Gammaproteobacteria bacterium]